MAELVIHGWECAGTRSTGMHDVCRWQNGAACSSFVTVADPMPTRALDAGQALGAVGSTQLSTGNATERLSNRHRVRCLPSRPVMAIRLALATIPAGGSMAPVPPEGYHEAGRWYG